MNWIEAIILGIIQGLTEFLPISSSGHLEIGKVLMGVGLEDSLTFTVVVHGATVLSTIVVFYQELRDIFRESMQFRYNESTRYILKILISMIPVFIVGLFFKDYVESLFSGNLRFVGLMLLVTAFLLSLTSFVKKDGIKKIPFHHAFIIGIAQALAVIPGISRSGATIATGVIMGNRREDMARFSFLMVLVPIIGANMLDIIQTDHLALGQMNTWYLFIGFVSAFVSGLLACRWMINIVKRGKLFYFAGYCAIVGIVAIIFA